MNSILNILLLVPFIIFLGCKNTEIVVDKIIEDVESEQDIEVNDKYINPNTGNIIPAFNENHNEILYGPMGETSSLKLEAALNENANFSYTLINGPINGIITECLDQVGSQSTLDLDCSFSPNAKFIGEDYITYKANNGDDTTEKKLKIIVYPKIEGEVDDDFINKGKINLSNLLDPSFKGHITANNMSFSHDESTFVLGTLSSLDGSLIHTAIWKYKKNGEPDMNFNNSGILLLNNKQLFSNSKYNGCHFNSDIKSSKNGDTFILGYCYDTESGTIPTVIGKILENGKLDQSFGRSGFLELSVTGAAANYPGKLVIHLDDTIYITGRAKFESPIRYDMFLFKVLKDGTLDGSFGDDGRIGKESIFGNSDLESSGLDLVIDSQGNIIVTGTAGSTNQKRLLAFRVKNDGNLDKFFANGGVYLGPEGYGPRDISVCGNNLLISGNGEQDKIFSLKLTQTGQIDQSYGSGAGQFIYEGDFQQGFFTYSAACDFSGNLYLSGFFKDGPLLRINSQGKLDQNFSSDGVLSLGNSESLSSSYVQLNQIGELFIGGNYLINDGSTFRGVIYKIK